MLCESACQQLSSWGDMLLSSAHFLWGYVSVIWWFFLQLIWQILRSKESASNFVSLLKKTAAETHRMLHKAFGDNAMSQIKTFLWHKRFKDRRMSVNDGEYSGQLSSSTSLEDIVTVRETILADCRQTIHDVCEVVGPSYGTVQRIVADSLNMRHISARFVPRLLSDDQKAHRISVCRELKQQARDDPYFISNIITGDETWVYGYDPETEQQSSQW